MKERIVFECSSLGLPSRQAKIGTGFDRRAGPREKCLAPGAEFVAGVWIDSRDIHNALRAEAGHVDDWADRHRAKGFCRSNSSCDGAHPKRK